ncbi:hypothetical protein S40293_04858 [Stachybotrys chartarum IBT 40293]|nr:hypothetical protein S40293_04858 [Stachybotrys chartarum IBT 40293]
MAISDLECMDHDELPPAYEPPSPNQVGRDSSKSQGEDDGRIDIDLDSRLRRTLSLLLPKEGPGTDDKRQSRQTTHTERSSWGIRLNIVIQVVGSRGDVQPFVALGTELQRHGHRVRLATHNSFADFVRKSGLEFFPIGGLILSMTSLRAGEVQKKRNMISEMLGGCWSSCIKPDPRSQRPFVAYAIIANPPGFAHIHCAQALGVPLHLMFTMMWMSIRAFCHPLANLQAANFISYRVVECIPWQGLGDVVGAWRHNFDVEPVLFFEGPCLAETLEIPFTYCWSLSLVLKPDDWPANIDLCGFFFRNAPDYQPEPELDDFLCRGPAPVYIGFGSIVIDDPDGAMAYRLSKAAADVVVKPIQAFSKQTEKGQGHPPNGAASSRADEAVFRRPAALEVPPQCARSRDISPARTSVVNAIASSAAGLGGLFKHPYKGMLLDVPLAATEGMLNATRLYNGEVYNPGTVTDWKSGGIVAGKNFTHGMVDALGGLVMRQIRGARQEGGLSVAKGAGIGLLNAGTKVTSGVLGLVAFSGQGIYQSVRLTMKRNTRTKIKHARREEGIDAVEHSGEGGGRVSEGRVIRGFDKLMLGGR